MKRRAVSVILMLLLAVGYGTFLHYYEEEDTNQAPQIRFDDNHLELSVNDDENRLLEGVHAEDAEDGDLTAEVIIDSISAFDSQKRRTVRYVVFDAENKATQATRTISYTDYIVPKLYLTDSLVQDTISVSKINKMAGATSCVDGDISNNVEVGIGKLQDNKVVLKISAYDSTGTETSLSVALEYDRTSYQSKIVLNEYLLYIPVGATYDFYENVKEVVQGSVEVPRLKEYVYIEGDLDFNTPGIYEVYYKLRDEANATAYTKGIVVIE